MINTESNMKRWLKTQGSSRLPQEESILTSDVRLPVRLPKAKKGILTDDVRLPAEPEKPVRLPSVKLPLEPKVETGILTKQQRYKLKNQDKIREQQRELMRKRRADNLTPRKVAA
jgi:hypothetical protein